MSSVSVTLLVAAGPDYYAAFGLTVRFFYRTADCLSPLSSNPPSLQSLVCTAYHGGQGSYGKGLGENSKLRLGSDQKLSINLIQEALMRVLDERQGDLDDQCTVNVIQALVSTSVVAAPIHNISNIIIIGRLD